jgi:transposase InsO family protein
MQRLNIDTIGPLPKSDDGCCYILVVIDTFSRYVELYATKTTQAEECAFQLLKHIGRYGAPAEITSDGGTQFVNEIVQSFLSIAKTQVNITIPYSKQENSIVERANKEVMRHLRAFIFDSMILTQWDLYLPLVMRILNAKIHESTGVSPAQLVLPGLDLDRRILTEDLSIEPQNLSAYASRLILMQDTAISVAQKYQLTFNTP